MIEYITAIRRNTLLMAMEKYLGLTGYFVLREKMNGGAEID